MKKSIRHNILLYVVLLIFICTAVIYKYRDTKTRAHSKPLISAHRPKRLRGNIPNLSCHDVKKCDALPSTDDTNFSPPNNSIFFHETSCRGNLTLRQACAVESAARTHPHRQIYVLFSSPVSLFTLKNTSLAKLNALKNVHFARIHANKYAQGTPLQRIVHHELKKSQFPIEHIADILRILTLYKFGGIYLDLDVIVVRPFDTLPSNWAARESNRSVSNGILAISKDGLGRRFVADIISEISKTFKPYLWSHNGPQAITRVLRNKMCSVKRIGDWSAATCNDCASICNPEDNAIIKCHRTVLIIQRGGLEVFGPKLFYPVPLAENGTYFASGSLKNMDAVYTHHTWNRMTSKLKIPVDSPYAKLGKMYCPIIFKLYERKYYYYV